MTRYSNGIVKPSSNGDVSKGISGSNDKEMDSSSLLNLKPLALNGMLFLYRGIVAIIRCRYVEDPDSERSDNCPSFIYPRCRQQPLQFSQPVFNIISQKRHASSFLLNISCLNTPMFDVLTESLS